MKKNIGFALTGSFCTLEKAFEAIRILSYQYEIFPILSEKVATTDTRFYKKEEVYANLARLCEKKPWTTIPEVEPVGPKKLLDLLVICPCTGNTLAKIAHGITDTSVTMAAKSHRRQGKRAPEINPDWENGIPQYPIYPGAHLTNHVHFGGNLWGVAEKLDYLETLGVKTIYLSPIFEAYSNHKYDTGDYMTVDGGFGGVPALDHLIEKAAFDRRPDRIADDR